MSGPEVTYLYCRPGVLDTPEGELQVDALLQALARELGFAEDLMLREDRGNSIVVPGVDRGQVWAAMDRIATHVTQRRLFILPGG